GCPLQWMPPPLRSPRATHRDWTTAPLPRAASFPSNLVGSPLDRATDARAPPHSLSQAHHCPPTPSVLSHFAPEHRNAAATTFLRHELLFGRFSPEHPPPSNSP